MTFTFVSWFMPATLAIATNIAAKETYYFIFRIHFKPLLSSSFFVETMSTEGNLADSGVCGCVSLRARQIPLPFNTVQEFDFTIILRTENLNDLFYAEACKQCARFGEGVRGRFLLHTIRQQQATTMLQTEIEYKKKNIMKFPTPSHRVCIFL